MKLLNLIVQSKMFYDLQVQGTEKSKLPMLPKLFMLQKLSVSYSDDTIGFKGLNVLINSTVFVTFICYFYIILLYQFTKYFKTRVS